MVETDWRELLSFSQRELKEADKEKLCESLSWMEVDDIELNFTDLKTLFRLAQDILKFKNEQVNNLLGQLETQRKGKGKAKGQYVASPTRSNDSVLDTIADQEEVIKANKEILEQLYADIAELEGKKSKLEERHDDDTESSRDALSEMNAVAQLENEITLKNRHIRKLLGDVKVLEDDNNKLKEKLSVLKDKLTEATAVIENLTDQVYAMNAECTKLKENLGYTKQSKTQLSVEIETLKQELQESESKKESFLADIKAKAQHWKDVARAKRTEIEALENENTKLKEEIIQTPKMVSPKRKSYAEEYKLKELQEKLLEASHKLLQSAQLIERLKAENEHLKSTQDDTVECSTTEVKNESDEGKERIIISKLKKRIKSLTTALSESEGLIASREKELAEMTARLHLVEKDDGVKALVDSLKQKKLQLKNKNDELKKIVKEFNSLNEVVDNLQLENETMRQKLNIPSGEPIDSKDIVSKYQAIDSQNMTLTKELKAMENKLVSVELENRSLIKKLNTLKKEDVNEMCNDEMPMDGGGESSSYLAKVARKNSKEILKQNAERDAEMQAITEENEGLRKGLQDILNFLKDNSKTTSGVLELQCPSLEAVLNSMEARHSAGWFAPHMAAVMELKAALGGRDALLTALNEARKETFDVMDKLSKESMKATKLEEKISQMESTRQLDAKVIINENHDTDVNIGEFGSWIAEDYDAIELNDKNEIINYIAKRDSMYENQLKSGLSYFHKKLNALYNKMTALAVQAADDRNNWRIEEEQYKAQIENLKSQIVENMDDSISENSPGLINVPDAGVLERRCSYLEENYRHIRTVNENIRNELLDCQRDAMLSASQYEAQINKFIFTVSDLTDKLRKSISIDLFWKQNNTLSDIIAKYRKSLNDKISVQDEPFNLMKRLDNDKLEVLNAIRNYFREDSNDKGTTRDKTSIESALFQKQIKELCNELNEKEKEIKHLQEKNVEFQISQSKLIDDNLAALPNKDIEDLRNQLHKTMEENKYLKEQNQHTTSQLNIALLQLQEVQHNKLDNDMEINMLRHQILDLQSTGDNRAIVARLSGEILVAHLQASEFQKKIDKLNLTLTNERRMRVEAEEMFKARHNVFNLYAHRYETKFRYLYEVMQVLRQQYEGCIPLISLEKYQNNFEELSRETHSVNAKLNEIEDLQANLIIKHSVYEQILDISKNKCLEEDDACQHKLQLLVMQSKYSRETDYLNKKIVTLEQTMGEMTKQCNYLEKTLLLINHGAEKLCDDGIFGTIQSNENVNAPNMEVEDLISDDDSASRRSLTITLPKPKVLKPPKVTADNIHNDYEKYPDLPGSPEKILGKKETINVFVQTNLEQKRRINKLSQTDKDLQIPHLNKVINDLKTENEKRRKEMVDSITLAKQQTIDILNLNTEKVSLETRLKDLQKENDLKDTLIKTLNSTADDLRRQLDSKEIKISKSHEMGNSVQQENKALLSSLKQIEKDKNAIVEEYQRLMKTEREEHAKSTKDLKSKIIELQTQLERRGSDSDAAYSEKLQEVVAKYSQKILELEDECFNLRNKLDGSKTDLVSYQNEVDRWKHLASERLTKMEQLSSQLEERHFHEVESYKAENQHWLSQLSETQREHLGLRAKLSEQKALHIKQLSDKDVQIEQLRSAIHTLKSQIMNMQTIMAVNDPSFDLSAIVEVEEVSDGVSQPGSERLELKFDSALDLQDLQDDARLPATSSTIWQEPIIERLRREKQLISKQNGMLRRQIKALASRERRARLDAHNLKNQVFRISTSGSRVATAETASLHNKIASLTAQLSSARRDSNSSVALWDKWKKAQQSSDRWQTRYEDKCQEVKKLEASLHLAKSTLSRLEKEKRVLLSRLNEVKQESKVLLEKQDGEYSEKSLREPESDRYESPSPLPVSSRALLDRVEAQQRRIAALEVAEKGNEILVAEYERSLAEITVLKGQVLKLESSLLESQIRTPMKTAQETQPELDYWKSYCEMLKEENMNLTMRINSIETSPTSSHQQRANDLEQTILTLRGLVSKLQSEQKSTLQKRSESSSRPSSGHSGMDKSRQLEPYRVEIANLKRTIQDKDLLLEKSKEMLKIAAEREEDLLQENTYLRRRLEELTNRPEGFLSA
ncbi:centrosomal protein of 290 kDa-like [Leguminivora glycinivorella]|uniref:centrosomal protein of 290 kDa-like n=1 Tax=Leguminivora glycinivorella TaxID=1035111 RepID=UPI002010A732|nr:centrosomal protein of 290 kDa-like [Leguminivora glycinivorella]